MEIEKPGEKAGEEYAGERWSGEMKTILLSKRMSLLKVIKVYF